MGGLASVGWAVFRFSGGELHVPERKLHAFGSYINELNATQRSLNSRRLSNLVALCSTTLSLRVRARSGDRLAEVPLG
jgi:hypothetical protein